jgi:hypothetical protein
LFSWGFGSTTVPAFYSWCRMKTADDFQSAAARAWKIQPPPANLLDQEAVSQVVAGWPDLQHRRRLMARLEFRTMNGERLVIGRWLLPRADGVYCLADLPE